MLNNSSKVIIDPVRKQKALIASAAVRLAKALNDPLYEQYKMYRDKATELKRKLVLKYAKAIIKRLREKGINVKVDTRDFSQ
jgi:hypothetical protein